MRGLPYAEDDQSFETQRNWPQWNIYCGIRAENQCRTKTNFASDFQTYHFADCLENSNR